MNTAADAPARETVTLEQLTADLMDSLEKLISATQALDDMISDPTDPHGVRIEVMNSLEVQANYHLLRVEQDFHKLMKEPHRVMRKHMAREMEYMGYL